MELDNETLREIRHIVGGRLRKDYLAWCKRLVWADWEIQDWAEQCATDGILAAQADIRQWDPSKGSFHYWCYLKAKTFARDWLRRSQKQRDSLDQFEPQVADCEDPIEELYSRYDERKALGQLKPEQQEVLALYYLYGMEVARIARILDCKEKTVYTILDRARKKAQENLEMIRLKDSRYEASRQNRPPPESSWTGTLFRLSRMRRES